MVYILIIASIFIVVLVISFGLYEKHSKKTMIEKLLSEFGGIPEAKFDARDLEDMKNYYKSLPVNGDIIDDITWNDLDMDLLFKRIKNTQSSVGDEYLYRFMRHQKTECNAHFEEVVKFMQDFPEERVECQQKLKTIGRKPSTKKYSASTGGASNEDYLTVEGISLSNFITNPASRPKMENWKRLVAIILSVLNITISFLSLSGLLGKAGLFILVSYGSLIIILGTVMALIFFKKQYATYEDLDSFIKLLNSAKAITKLSIPVLENELETLTKDIKKFSKFNTIETILLTSSSMYVSILNILFMLHTHTYQRYLSIVQKNRDAAKEIFDIIGYIELCITTASYRKSIPNYCHPNFSNNCHLSFENMVHPFLETAVPNSDVIGEKIIITGSNASGKSTFAKTLALNTYMGQVFNMCFADSFSFKHCTVITSMSIKDDISQGDSYFVAEVKTIRRMFNNISVDRYCMLFLDEIFKGTNTIERIASATAVMQKFAVTNCFICLTTHDLELSSLLDDSYENYHFTELVGKEDIEFDYKLKHGIVNGSNAIKMLKYHKIDKDIVDRAQSYADNFRKKGKWSIVIDNFAK